MLRSCKYCGRIHDSKKLCAEKSRAIYKRKDKSRRAEQIHQSHQWKSLSQQIRERDTSLCQVCRRRLFETVMEFNPYTLSVHHIEPIEENPQRAFDPANLITLCRMHHDMAERGAIPREALAAIAAEQENQNE